MHETTLDIDDDLLEAAKERARRVQSGWASCRSRVHGARQLTDAYLLALAVHHGGRLVTFDRAAPRAAVKGATSKHLMIL